jgi:hypothetical protein
MLYGAIAPNAVFRKGQHGTNQKTIGRPILFGIIAAVLGFLAYKS